MPVPYFYDEGNQPKIHDPAPIILQKILGAVRTGPSEGRITVNSADASAAAVDITAAPDSSKFVSYVVLDSLVASSDTALRIDIKEETSGTVFLRLYMAANSTVSLSRFVPGIKAAVAGKKIQIQTSAAGNISVWASYHSEA